MLRSLVRSSIRFRVLVVIASAVLLIAGTRAAIDTPIDVFPEFAPPLVEVQTEAPGLSTEEVESLITVPLETALIGVPYLRTLRSKSVLGLSSVVMLFEQGTDLLRARQVVQERLQTEARLLPVVARPPVLLAPLSSMSRVLKIGVSSKTLSQQEMSVLARWTVRPRLMAVRGVANVAIWGLRDPRLEVLVDPDRLRAHEVTLDAVLRAAGEASLPSAGGFVDTPNQRLAIRHTGTTVDPEDLARTVIAVRGRSPVRLGDVAEVRTGHAPPIGDAVIDDGPGLLMIVEKQPWGNTLEVTEGVERALETLRPGLAGVTLDPTIFRPATFIERAIANLRNALGIGCLLVVVVLLAFLGDWRTSLISLIAIPLSLVTAALVLAQRGGTINTMVLAGLVIAVGEVVDDAIIDVENIVRRLRLNAALPEPRAAHRVVLEASLEVRSAVVYATLIVTLVFVPVFFLEGVAGAFFRPLGLAYVIAILSSLLVALTVTPALSLLLLRHEDRERHDPPVVVWLKARYARILPRLLARPRAAAATLVIALAATALGSRFLGEEFLPDFRETDFLMHWVEKPGTSIDAGRRTTALVSRELRSIPGVRNFGSHIGRTEVADEVVGPNFTEFWVSIDPAVDHDRTVARIKDVIAGYPGAFRDVLTYLKERIKEVLTGASATIVVRIYGPELPILRAKAEEVARALREVQGVADLKVEQQVLVPQIDVRLRPEEAAAHGVSPADVRRAATVLVKGQKVGEVYDRQRVVEVAVWGAPEVRSDVSALRRLPIAVASGAEIPLGAVASVEIAPAPNEIKRENASRRIDVTCNVTSGIDLGTVARAVEGRVRALSFDREYHAELLGEYAEREASRRKLLLLAAASLAAIVVIIQADFRSVRLTLLTLVTLPFALIGSVAAAFAAGGVLSIGSIVGFVTVLGIAARNGIMLVSHWRHLAEVEGEPSGEALVRRGAMERLAPILMTALCAGLALVPIVIRGPIPGHEIEHPMAVVILGGLVTSTVMNLALLPALYLAYGMPGRPRATGGVA